MRWLLWTVHQLSGIHYNDEKLKKELAEAVSKQFNMAIRPEDSGCLRCHGPIRKPCCANCSIQRCKTEKRILTCTFCDEFPYHRLEKYYEKESMEMNPERTY